MLAAFYIDKRSKIDPKSTKIGRKKLKIVHAKTYNAIWAPTCTNDSF